MLTNTICFINQKGGCGKSSSCFHLGGHFAKLGLRVLLIDADPQGSLSQGLFGSTAIEGLRARETLAAIFDEDEIASPNLLVLPTQFERLSVIRANAQLAKHNTPEPEKAGMKQFALASFLENVPGFDLILIDCPPNLCLCSWNAMLASNFVVIPVPPEDFATQGLRTVHQAIEEARLLQPDTAPRPGTRSTALPRRTMDDRHAWVPWPLRPGTQVGSHPVQDTTARWTSGGM